MAGRDRRRGVGVGRDNGVPGRSRFGVGLLTRGLYLALWAMLLVGFTGGAFYLAATVTGAGGGGGRPASKTAVPSSPVGPSGWAVLYLEAYLQAGQGTEASLAPYLGAASPSWPTSKRDRSRWPRRWRSTRSRSASAQAIGASPSPPRSSALPPAPAGDVDVVDYRAAGGLGHPLLRDRRPVPRRRLRGRHSPHGDRGTAGTGGPSHDFGSSQPAAVGDPVADAATHFLQALLAGQGEIGRYLAPGAAVAPVTPAPFAEVAVTGLSEAKVGGPAGAAPRLMVLVGAEETGSRPGRPGARLHPRHVPAAGPVGCHPSCGVAAAGGEHLVPTPVGLTQYKRSGRSFR